MHWLLRMTATLAIIGLAVLTLHRYVILPYQCNVRLKKATHDLDTVLSLAGASLRTAQLARETISDLRSCVTASPDDIGAQMVLAASYRALGLNRQAVAAYKAALLYDRRPELYLNLGQAELTIGDSKSALQNLVLAGVYNPAYLDEIAQYHPEVKKAIDEYQLRLIGPKH